VIDKNQVLHIAKLAQLKLGPSELEKFSRQLSETLDYVKILTELDKKTKNLFPTSQVTDLKNIFREDEVKPSLTKKEVLANAKRRYKGYFGTEAIFE